VRLYRRRGGIKIRIRSRRVRRASPGHTPRPCMC
jgi:hypothetical protein